MILFKNDHLTVFQSQLFKTTSTVIHTSDGIIVVDPTWLPREVDEIKDYVANIRQRRPVYLLFTHSDYDHIIGYGAFPGAKVIASKEFRDNSDKESILEQIHSFDHQYYLDRDYTITYPDVDIVVREDFQQLKIGTTSLTFYKAIGHNHDGIFTIIEPLGIWIAGDYLSDVEFPYIYYSSEKYQETLAKCDGILERHPISLLVPGHGKVTDSLEEIKQRKKDSLDYIHQLRNAVRNNLENQHLIEGYAYPKGMKSFHEDNIKLISKEMGIHRNK